MGKKSDIAVKLSLVFLISLLSFAVGTFVGKKYSDNQHKLASMEPSSHGSEIAGTEHDRDVASEHANENNGEHSTNSKKDALSDKEIADLAEQFVEDETNAEHGSNTHEVANHENTHGNDHESTPTKETSHESANKISAKSKDKNEHAADPHAKAESSHDVASTEVKVQKPTHDQKSIEHNPTAPAHDLIEGKKKTPVSAAKETRWPSSIPKDIAQYSVGKFTVQVASFNNETEAKNRAESLKSKGYSAFYIPAVVHGESWYRVSIGLFATEKEAKEYRTEYLSKAKGESALVQKISN